MNFKVYFNKKTQQKELKISLLNLLVIANKGKQKTESNQTLEI